MTGIFLDSQNNEGLLMVIPHRLFRMCALVCVCVCVCVCVYKFKILEIIHKNVNF